MSQQTKFLLTLGLCVLCTGCVGTGPNTQQGAVAGGALGALAGAIIGNNSGSHNGLAGALIGGTVGAIAGGTIGNSVDNQRGTIYHSEQEAVTTVAVQQPPPPPLLRRRSSLCSPDPPGAIWINGYYIFDGYRYVWVAGTGKCLLPAIGPTSPRIGRGAAVRTSTSAVIGGNSDRPGSDRRSTGGPGRPRALVARAVPVQRDGCRRAAVVAFLP